MSEKKKAIVITLVVTVISFVLAQMIFVTAPEIPEPTSAQLPFLIVLGIIESFAMGSALAYLFLYWERAKMHGMLLVHLSLVWLIGSWWVHDGLHRTNGHDLTGLIMIEYGFHVTLIIAAFIVARNFLKNLRGSN